MENRKMLTVTDAGDLVEAKPDLTKMRNLKVSSVIATGMTRNVIKIYVDYLVEEQDVPAGESKDTLINMLTKLFEYKFNSLTKEGKKKILVKNLLKMISTDIKGLYNNTKSTVAL